MDITIRSLHHDDYAQWLPLWLGYNAFYGREGPTALADAVTQSTWERFFDASMPVHALVAADGDRIIGLAHYLFHLTTTAVAPTCYLNDLFTAADARVKGVARALITAVKGRADEGGAARLYWQTHESNASARHLYDKVASFHGFIVYRAN